MRPSILNGDKFLYENGKISDTGRVKNGGVWAV
jgi:hypothetical protein